MLGNENWGVVLPKWLLFGDWLALVCREQMIAFASLGFFLSLPSLTKLSLSQRTSFPAFALPAAPHPPVDE